LKFSFNDNSIEDRILYVDQFQIMVSSRPTKL
jgi:hypothetical protein